MEYKFVSIHFWILRSFFIILHFLCQPLWKYNSHIGVNVEQMSHKIVTYYVEDLNVQESQELVLIPKAQENVWGTRLHGLLRKNPGDNPGLQHQVQNPQQRRCSHCCSWKNLKCVSCSDQYSWSWVLTENELFEKDLKQYLTNIKHPTNGCYYLDDYSVKSDSVTFFYLLLRGISCIQV